MHCLLVIILKNCSGDLYPEGSGEKKIVFWHLASLRKKLYGSVKNMSKTLFSGAMLILLRS